MEGKGTPGRKPQYMPPPPQIPRDEFTINEILQMFMQDHLEGHILGNDGCPFCIV